jgi:hypothetical protein
MCGACPTVRWTYRGLVPVAKGEALLAGKRSFRPDQHGLIFAGIAVMIPTKLWFSGKEWSK